MPSIVSRLAADYCVQQEIKRRDMSDNNSSQTPLADTHFPTSTRYGEIIPDKLVEQIKQQQHERAQASGLTVANPKSTLTSARKELNAMCEDLLGNKGATYAHSSMDNETGQRFKKAATELGITPIQVAMVYASKHWASIQKWVQDGCVDDVSGGEPIEGRIADLRNYLDFIFYLRKDSKNG